MTIILLSISEAQEEIERYCKRSNVEKSSTCYTCITGDQDLNSSIVVAVRRSIFPNVTNVKLSDTLRTDFEKCYAAFLHENDLIDMIKTRPTLANSKIK